MKKLTYIPISILIIFIFSCKEIGKTKKEKDAYYDSISVATTGKTIRQRAIEKTDSMIKEQQRKALFDTTGLYKAPIKVINARLVEEKYSSYRNIRLTYKNTSKKKISAVKFKWYGLNAFNEPADMGSSLLEGFGGGFSDDALSAGKSTSATWNIYSKDGKKVILAWPFEVAFTDGTSWKLNEL